MYTGSEAQFHAPLAVQRVPQVGSQLQLVSKHIKQCAHAS